MKEHPYFAQVWRLLFTCTREPEGWEPMNDPALFDRIFDAGVGLGRNLHDDLDTAQTVVDRHGKFDDWIREATGEPAST